MNSWINYKRLWAFTDISHHNAVLILNTSTHERKMHSLSDFRVSFKLKTKILRVDAKLHYSLLYTKQNWSKAAQFFSLIIALGDNLTNFFFIQIVWSDGITLLNCFYPLITFDCGRGSDMPSLCEVKKQQALFSCSYFYEI